MKPFDPSTIPQDQITPLVATLLRVIQAQADEIALLKDEIAKLKGQKGRPNIRPSSLEKPRATRNQTSSNRQETPPVGRKEKRKEERIIEPADLPPGSRFKGYKTYIVQDIVIQAVEITFKIKVYTTPDGKTVRGEMPKEYASGHFGAELVAHCLQLYHGGFMTEPAILEYLYEQGVDISAGQLHAILTGNTEEFSEEMEAVVQAGKEHSKHLNADDTGARHNGENGVCTCLSSPLFSYFHSSESKSRLNFLKILRGQHEDYLLDEGALLYAFEHGLSKSSLDKMDAVLDEIIEQRFPSEKAWRHFLWKHGITGSADIRILSEGAVLSSAIVHGLPEGIPIVSDAAPQFMIWASHALCWIHEERHYRKLVPVSEEERKELEKIRGQIWNLYEHLKEYSKNRSHNARRWLEMMFESVFNRSGVSDGLDNLLRNTYSRKAGLLQVLEHLDVPLHNNDCERDIRQYVKRRKISGTTRSDIGKKARDMLLSLKKTCQKLGVSFFGYLRDRVHKLDSIPPLREILIAKAKENLQRPVKNDANLSQKVIGSTQQSSGSTAVLQPAISF